MRSQEDAAEKSLRSRIVEKPRNALVLRNGAGGVLDDCAVSELHVHDAESVNGSFRIHAKQFQSAPNTVDRTRREVADRPRLSYARDCVPGSRDHSRKRRPTDAQRG